MTTWTDTATLNTDPNDPVTSELLTALKNNPKAMAEGAAGAPRIAVNWVGGVANSGNLTLSGLNAYAGIIVHGHVAFGDAGGGSVDDLEMAFSDNGTTFYGTTTLLNPAGPGVDASFTLAVNFASGNWRLSRRLDQSAASPTGTVGALSEAVTHMRFIAGSAVQCAIMAFPNGGPSAT